VGMNPTEVWAGKFGTDYTGRNQLNFHRRVPFWRMIHEETGDNVYLEVGCNAGWNLKALAEVHKHNPEFFIGACEVNQDAIWQCNSGETVFDVRPIPAIDLKDSFHENAAEMVFSVGVLIHIPPEDLDAVVKGMVACAKRHVLVVEYYSEEVREIEYQGEMGLLWKRPWDKVIEKAGGSLVLRGELGEADGFDPNGVTYFLFEV
jgi:hypothetical protein